jgi:hypothetical protein
VRKMKIFKRTIALFVVVAVIGVYCLFNKTTFMDGSRLDNQVSQLIKQKDFNQIKKIAANDSTYNFLINLPKDTKPLKTSGNQGSDGKLEYFVTVLDGKKVDVLLKQSFRYGGLIKKIELSQISLQQS